MNGSDVKEIVRETYSQAARRVSGGGSSCCGGSCGGGAADPITSNLYDHSQKAELPAEAVLGCGNPTALAQLNPGEIVLDLGSGGGIDVLLSAKRSSDHASVDNAEQGPVCPFGSRRVTQ